MENFGLALAVTVTLVVALALLCSEASIFRLKKSVEKGAMPEEALRKIAVLRFMGLACAAGAALIVAASLAFFH